MSTIEFLRQFRIGSFAIFDLATAFVGMWLISPLLSRLFRKLGLEIPRSSWLLWTVPIGIAVHLLIGRVTPLTRDFLDWQGHYLAKIVVVGLLIWGIMGVKRAQSKGA
ncbi:hypothetical protein EPO05_04415 [Patescibacteria group bacterium]|nr:MAG: hypothetical protein EPO05_04415 [Patescibacteria group bacterium]